MQAKTKMLVKPRNRVITTERPTGNVIRRPGRTLVLATSIATLACHMPPRAETWPPVPVEAVETTVKTGVLQTDTGTSSTVGEQLISADWSHTGLGVGLTVHCPRPVPTETSTRLR